MGNGRHLGVRKLEDGTCTWVARVRDDAGKRQYRALGQVTDDNDFNAAKSAAEAFFEDVGHGVVEKPITVAEACKAYVAQLEAEGRMDTAYDARGRFERHVYGRGGKHPREPHPIAKVRLDRLTTPQLRDWRNALPGQLASQNRYLNVLRAALNMAVADRRVSAAAAENWRAVKVHKNAERRRTLYLDIEQRRQLLKACSGGIRDLVEAAILTGARPGELASVKRADFDHRTGTISFRGKTGPRTVPLSPAAVELFKRCARGKHPNAHLLLRDDGQPWNRYDWDDLIREARAKAKLPSGTVLYTLRHSWITEALLGGMTTLDVARLTGTSLAMIERHYGHLVVGSARERLAQVPML